MTKQTIAYRNGIYLPKDQIRIEPDDLGFERGFAVFDYCRERNGNITFLKDHLRRFAHSQEILNLRNPVLMDDVEQIMMKMQAENQLTDSYFKMIISGKLIQEQIEPVLTIYQDNYNPYPEEIYESGISLIIHEFAKPFPAYKTTFYLGALQEYTRMKENKADDVLYYFNNLIRECSRCNIFIIKGDTIYTPDQNLLKGVTRQHVIKCAKENFFVIEHEVSIEKLFHADEVFITSTTRNIVPVIKIEDQLIGAGQPGRITKALISRFHDYCTNYDTP